MCLPSQVIHTLSRPSSSPRRFAHISKTASLTSPSPRSGISSPSNRQCILDRTRPAFQAQMYFNWARV